MKKIVALLGLVAAIILGGCASYSYRGAQVDPPVKPPDLKLTDTGGNSFALSSQRGRVVLLYFGYTNCPDACPLTLSRLAEARRALGQDGANVSLVFTTTDPERDTADVLRRYVAQFDPSIIALRGSPDELAAVYQAYHVDVVKEEPTAGSSGYWVGHSALVYVIDKAGLWRESLDAESTVQDIVSDLQQLIKE